ncbi:unnamed protein product [Schistosoma mattheei]|uniref:Uncharacterized protein n=1 Tax=Schistosoma mattheei TaxID=31246 RepID=A0A183NUI0_9TREM|nr:unnamed protein product [Schistosoma mattheei]
MPRVAFSTPEQSGDCLKFIESEERDNDKALKEKVFSLRNDIDREAHGCPLFPMECICWISRSNETLVLV